MTNDSGKQARLREIKEKSYSVTSFSPVRVSEELMQDFRWLLQQLDLAWRVNAVAREKMLHTKSTLEFNTDEKMGGPKGYYLVVVIDQALTQMDALEKGMK